MQTPTIDHVIAALPKDAALSRSIALEAKFDRVFVSCTAEEDGTAISLTIRFPSLMILDRTDPKWRAAGEAVLSLLSAIGIPKGKLPNWFHQECLTVLSKKVVSSGTYDQVIVSFMETDDEQIQVGCSFMPYRGLSQTKM